MNALLLLLLVTVPVILFAVALYFRRARKSTTWDFPILAPIVIGWGAGIVLVGGSFALSAIHAHTAEATTVRTTVDLVADEDTGDYVTAKKGILGPLVDFKTPDEDGWVADDSVSFARSTIKEGDNPSLVTEDKIAAAGFLWPWSVVVDRTYTFTVPAGTAAGIVPKKG